MLLDIKMPGMDGMEVLRKLHALDETLPVVDDFRPRHDQRPPWRRSGSGAFDFLDKPLSSERVIVTLQNVLEAVGAAPGEPRAEARDGVEVRDRRRRARRCARCSRRCKRAAPTNATVLLLGESGVGKELVARTIHRNSPRAGQRFVQVNCAAIPEELIESELFGHEKGSFTGATEKQIGKFEQADRGTIFLDEVGDMSPKTQAKVLRVLQEQEVERLGSARTIKVDVRVIAATNKNLEEAIQRGEFREDLFFRLNVIPIVVPPLRERREDIPLLVQHFARRTSEEHNLKPKRFDAARDGGAAALPLARQHPRAAQHRRAADDHDARPTWCASRICRRRSGAASRPRRAVAVAGARPRRPRRRRRPHASAPPGGTLREFKDAAERAYLVQKLRENNWNISKTAEVIDTPRSNLYKKLEQYGIKQEVDG